MYLLRDVLRALNVDAMVRNRYKMNKIEIE